MSSATNLSTNKKKDLLLNLEQPFEFNLYHQQKNHTNWNRIEKKMVFFAFFRLTLGRCCVESSNCTYTRQQRPDWAYKHYIYVGCAWTMVFKFVLTPSTSALSIGVCVCVCQSIFVSFQPNNTYWGITFDLVFSTSD